MRIYILRKSNLYGRVFTSVFQLRQFSRASKAISAVAETNAHPRNFGPTQKQNKLKNAQANTPKTCQMATARFVG